MSLFSFIKSQVAILDVINEHTRLKKAGIYWKGTCPFHQEKTASFTVSPHKEIFYCFGCHTGGDVITFVAKIEQCSPLEAARLLIDRYGLTIPDTLSHEAPRSNEEKLRYFELCCAVATWCHANLIKTPSVMKYMRARGINSESLAYFNVGYFAGGLAAIKSLLSHMREHDFLPDDLLKAQILSQGKTVLYSPFEERIIFPIKDHMGNYCGFGGRVFKPDDTRAKYYNSKEHAYFAKGSLLFGIDQAKKAIQQQEAAFIVEGYTDCISMVQAGYHNTVATLGTAVSFDHLKTLSRYASMLYVVFDADNAGQEAIMRITELCWQVNMDVRVICLPAQEDPASYLHRGNSLAPLIEQSCDIFEFYIKRISNQFSSQSLGQKLAVARKITGLIAGLDDPLKQDILLQKASKTLDLPYDSIKNEVLKTPGKAQPQVQKAKIVVENLPSSKESPDGPDKLEKKIFFAIMNKMHLFSTENEEYLRTYLPHPMGNILSQLKQEKDRNPSLSFIQFFDLLTPDDQPYVTKLLMEFDEIPCQKEFEHLVLQLHKKHWKLTVHSIKTKLAHARAHEDEQSVAKILHEFSELKKKMVHKNLI